MLTRLLAASVFTASLGVFLGQAAPVPFDWGTVAGGAVSGIPVAGVLAWQLHQRERKLDERDAEIRQLHRDNREMTERIAAQLAESTRALAEAAEGMEATITRNQPNETLSRELRRLETLLREAQRRQGGGRT